MNRQVRNIVLVGPMGAGKTTTGRQLAREIGFEFRDSDREIEARCGADIPWIFDVEGEAGFRARESSAIEELCAQSGIVLATGGGAVIDPENRHHLLLSGFIVYLHTTVAQQYERTRKDRRRPLLQAANPAAVLGKLMAQREPIYRELADLIIPTDRMRPRALIREILAAFHAFRCSTGRTEEALQAASSMPGLGRHFADFSAYPPK